MMKIHLYSALLLTALLCSCGSGIKENKVLGKYPAICYDYSQKGDRLSEKWEEKLQKAKSISQAEKILEDTEKAMEKYNDSEPVDKMKKAREEIKGRDIPFEWLEHPDMEITSIKVADEDKYEGTIDLEPEIVSSKDRYSGGDVSCYYLILDSRDNVIYKHFLRPFDYRLTIDKIRLECKRYDFSDFALIRFVDKETYNNMEE